MTTPRTLLIQAPDEPSLTLGALLYAPAQTPTQAPAADQDDPRDPHTAKPRPAVLIAHAWRGQDALVRHKAMELASLGYVGVAMDVYGHGVFAQDADQASALMTPLRQDRARLRQRLRANLEAIQAQPEVDPTRIAVLGYCFGGLCALELARDGAPVRAAVSFHGLLDAQTPAQPGQVTARVLICHGWDDPLATPSDVLAIAHELTQAGADWQLHAYGATAHAFTNPAAQDLAAGLVYHPTSAARAWRAALALLEESFEAPPAT